ATPAVPARPVAPAARVTPAPMNVPSRPQAVTPAGPRLETKTQVRIAGPKVVRVEAPEQVQAPRPRRIGPPGAPGSPRPGEDDRSRSPRRRDTPSPAAAPGKRSSGVGVPERRRGRSDSDWVGSTRGIFSEKDLIEREEKLARSGGFLKKRKQDAANKLAHDHADDGPSEGRLRIAAPFTIKDLSAATGVKASDIVKKLFMQGVMKKINDAIEPEKAIEIMMDFDIDLEVTQAQTAEEVVSSEFERREAKDLRARGPVVTILGHVDHGKTSLLDKIRNTNVAAGEAGGITQKTSAFVVNVEVEGRTREVVFLDTPGHEAFTSMRSRGAKMTDVVVLVVSAPEGVMPQTIESINHAKAAKVPLVVALNKIDRPDATESQVQKTLGQLAAAGLNPAEWGGDTEVIRTSATTGQGIKELLEALDYQSQLLELKADFAGAGQGIVVESKMEEGRGAVASILLQQGLLKVGDFVVMGRSFGRVRDISDDKGRRVKEASPPLPVQISGIDEVCDAGDKFYVVDSLKKAQEAAEQRRQRERHVALAQPRVTLDNIFTQISDKEVKEILVVLKTDQQGTVDVLKGECEKVKGTEVKVRVLHAAVGGITESDVLLADASKAIVIGFNVIPSGKARQLAESKGVEIRTYQVIYDITDDLRKAAEGMLAPELREEVLGHAEVRQVFKISKVGSIAGCYVTDGTVQRDALIRVTRNGVVIEHDRKLAQLKRLKDDAKDVRAGMECGMKIDGYDDIKEGDVLECYKKVEVKRTL
ncbi:MAG: translation initiation factor, partial [Planctomycetota bacterium]